MSALSDFRKQYPQYDDWSDFDLATALHSKYYSDIPIEDYFARLGVEETTTLGAIGEFGKRALGGVGTGLVSTVTGVGQLLPFTDDEALQEAESSARETVSEALGYDTAYDESYIAQLGQTVGEMVPQVASFFVPGGAFAKTAQAAAMVGPAVSEGARERTQFEEETGQDLTTGERLVDKSKDVALGFMEKLGFPRRLAAGLPKGFFQTAEGRPILRALESAAISGVQEGTQEVVQGIARDLGAKAIYNPDREIGDSLIDDFTLGGGAGALFDIAISSALGVKRRRGLGEPEEIPELTEEERIAEEELRAGFQEREEQKRLEMDQRLEEQAQRELEEAEAPVARLDTQGLDENRSARWLANKIEERVGTRMPIGRPFEVVQDGDKYAVKYEGEQFGPKFSDPLKASELMVALSDKSYAAKKEVELEYITENSPDTYEGEAKERILNFGRAIPSPDERIISASDAIKATGKRDISARINAQRGTNGLGPTNRFTLNEIKAANNGDIGALGDVIAETDADERAFRGREAPYQQGVQPRPGQPAIGMGRQQALQRFSQSFDQVLPAEQAFTQLLQVKGIDAELTSPEFRGLIKRIIGKAPSKKSPLESLKPNERRYLYQRIRQLPSFRPEGVTSTIPDFSMKVPDSELVRIARRQIGVGRPVQVDPDRVLDGLVGKGILRQDVADALRDNASAPAGFNPSPILDTLVRGGLISPEVARSLLQGAPRQEISQAEIGRVEREARRTARPIERATEEVPEGQELVPYNPNESALGQQLRDMAKKYGIDDVVATRMVDQLAEARRDSEGNVYLLPQEDSDYGSFTPMANVIQVAMDGVRSRVAEGMPPEEAVAATMNHEVLHALRNLDLFTPQEWSLLERLSRKYEKPGTSKSYTKWASDTYSDQQATIIQEEAIAEMISDALTSGVVLEGNVVKPSGKPRAILNKIVSFFKDLLGIAQRNDIESFSELVEQIKTGKVGRRERDVVRTRLRGEFLEREVPRRGITAEQLAGYQASIRGGAEQPRQGQAIGDAPSVDEALLSRREPPAYRDETNLLNGRRAMAKELEDAGVPYGATVDEALDYVGNLSPEARRLILAMDRDDFLGFSDIDGALSAVFDENIDNWNPSQGLKSAIGRYNNTSWEKTVAPLYQRRTGTDVVFEVAPDPNNKELSGEWRAIPVELQEQISEQIADVMARKLKSILKTGGRMMSHTGSYLDDTNRSFSYTMASGDPARFAKALGYVLNQDSVMVVSPEKFSGAERGKAVVIEVKTNDTQEIADIYDTLRNIQGIDKISGQTTVDGNMTILLDQNMDAQKMADAFDAALDGQFKMYTADVYAAFIDKSEYNYASGKSITRDFGEVAGSRIGSLKSEAESRLTRAIDAVRNGQTDSGVVPRGLEGAVNESGKLKLSHFSGRQILRTDPSKAGTGLDKTKRTQSRIPVTYFGITDADIDPYVQEPGLGNVDNRFEVDANRVYPASSGELLVRLPNSNVLDVEATLRNLNENGYIGFWTNNAELGKVALINKPLISDAAKAEGLTDNDFDEGLPTLRQRDPAKVERVVEQNIKAAEDAKYGPAKYSAKASPEAQYIAQNPNEAQELPVLKSTREYEGSARGKAAMNNIVKPRPTNLTSFEIFHEATGEGRLTYWLTKFKQEAVNRYARIEELNRDPRLKGNLADSSSIAAALFADRARGIVGAAIKNGVPVYSNGVTEVKPFIHNGRRYRGLLEVMSLLYSKEHGDLTKLAQAYAISQRSTRLDKDGKPTPVTKADRDAVEAEVRALTDANGNNPILEWHDAWQAYNSKTIEFLRDTGMLTDEMAEQWKNYADYVPFYRAAEGAEGLPKVAANMFGGLSSGAYFKPYKGSTEAVNIDMLEAISHNLAAAIEMGMRNVAQQRIARDMQSLGLAQQVKTRDADKKITATFRVNGRKVSFEIYDPLVFESMQPLGGEATLQAIKGTLGFPATMLRELITRDPAFMLANMLRDTLSASVTSGANFIPVIDTVKGLGDGMEMLEMAGVVGGYDYRNDPGQIGKFYRDEMAKRGYGPDAEGGSALGMFKSIWDWAGQATTISDAATRNAVYKDVLARTGNHAEALFQAMEVINFSRRGSNLLARALTATIPFLNARFQGLDVFYRSATGRYSTQRQKTPGEITASFIMRGGILAAMTGIYYSLVSDDEQYKEQSDEVRDNYWLLPTAWGAPIRIPIPFEVGLLFKVVPETILAASTGDKSRPEVTDTLIRGITSTLEINPAGIQAIAPAVEVAFNHDFYTGRQIVPFYMDQKISDAVADSVGSSEIGKLLGKTFDMSPRNVDHLMRGYGGTIGGYILDLTDTVWKSEFVKGDQVAARPALRVTEFPVIKRFFGQVEGSGLKQDAYELYSSVETVVNTMNKLTREGRKDELDAYLSSPTKQRLLNLKGTVYSIKKQLDKARKQREQMLRADMSPEEKQRQIEIIDSHINEYLSVMPKLKEAADQPYIEATFYEI